ANSKRAAKKQTIKEIESDSCEIEDNIDAEFLSSELLEVDVDATQQSGNDSGKKKTAKANSKRAAKKQTIKEIESDSGEIEDNIDAEFLSSKLPEVNDDASTELSVPTTQTKRAIEKLSDISNQPSTQARQSGNNSGKKKTAKANSKRATKKQTMKKIESDSGEIEDNIDAELLSSKLPEVDDDASTKLSVPITRSKKTTDSNQPLIQAQQRKKRTAKANLKRATKKNKQ
ncbi:8506_t:CDS:2, partial [Gigaspora rosea]